LIAFIVVMFFLGVYLDKKRGVIHYTPHAFHWERSAPSLTECCRTHPERLAWLIAIGIVCFFILMKLRIFH
jgi:hypothetical protein